jgi:phosphoribosyl 1,2-cyclic phosphodiesterase
MKLTVLGSSSSGNCYLLENDRECLVIECGLPFRLVKEALGFNILKIVGVVASHSHKDHYGYAEDYLKCGISVYAPEETHKSIHNQYSNKIAVKCGYWYQIGGFNITPFEIEHDVECFGYLIRHEDFGCLLFATDTCFIRDNFKKLAINHIMIEANYSETIVNELLQIGAINEARVNRTLKTHMELSTCRDFITANMTPSFDSVLLLHLSDGNSNAVGFQQTIQEVVGDKVTVRVADKNVTYPLDICPF